ncbi:uncharacterized protein LOC106865540 isoform X1 [Brachypodium distachyon]|nr:uncharacterized protein LOC106865540 isoform X1 [Brachypodium distachyon]|eukprot:XP_024313438.1 uncharacterized protein LOC106865540 isoform X1 [Brachypodium distachyon]
MLVGSWDGVVCLKQGILQVHSRFDDVPREAPFGFYVHQFVLWNPVAMTSATVGVPGPDHRQHQLGHIIGGYAHLGTRRFHLLHASGETNGGFRISPTPFRILSVGDDAAWRELPFLLGEEDTFPEIIMGKGNVVRLHDNLHWLAQPSSSSSGTRMQLRVLVFDTTREKFLLMETVTAKERPGGPLCVYGWHGSACCRRSSASSPWSRRQARWSCGCSKATTPAKLLRAAAGGSRHGSA